jgi:hypothetical protein
MLKSFFFDWNHRLCFVCSKNLLQIFLWRRRYQISCQFYQISIDYAKKKQWYVCKFSKTKIIIENVVKIIELMNSKTKINVMIKKLMNKTRIIMCFESRLRLIFHIEHDMNFDEICDDVELNIEELKTRHHIFVIIHTDYQLILD